MFDSLANCVNLLSFSRFMQGRNKDEESSERLKHEIIEIMSQQMFNVASGFNLDFSSAVAILLLVKYIDAKLFDDKELMLALMSRVNGLGQTWLEVALASYKAIVE